MTTKTWKSFDGTTEEVEVGSDREKELLQKLEDAGLTIEEIATLGEEHLRLEKEWEDKCRETEDDMLGYPDKV